MQKRPKISILTPSKNSARFLRSTIESITQQSFTDYEHVVVDSESTDETIDILREYDHIRWISEPDRHTDEGIWKAAQIARGEYIMLICVSDGYLDKDWFAKCVQVLDNDPEVSLVYGVAQHMTEDGRLVCVQHRFFIHPPPQKMAFFPFWLGTFSLLPEITFCVRAEVFRKCFPKFDPDANFLRAHGIFSFNYRFNKKGFLPYFIPCSASYGRSHHDSNSVRLSKTNSMMKRQYRAAIVSYGNKVLSGKVRHVFRDKDFNIVGQIEPEELHALRRKVLDYRINRKEYRGKNRIGGIGYWRRKCRILAGYYLCGRIFS